MAHVHIIVDHDKHFIIDPITKKIQPENPEKNKLVRYDHNSERYTFEMDRMLEGHDMSLCDIVQIHYINVSSNKQKKNEDIYEVNDLGLLSGNEDRIAFTWLVSRNATMLDGILTFAIRFACSNGDSIDYELHTEIFSSISISNTIINNGQSIVEEYSDILNQWKKELFGIEGTIQTAKRESLAAIDKNRTDSLNAINQNRNESLSAIESDAKQALERIDVLHTNSMSEITNNKTESIKAIELAKTNSLEAIDRYGLVQVSEDEPSNPNIDVYIRPLLTETFTIPEIMDLTISPDDTWSSEKINAELNKVNDDVAVLKEDLGNLEHDINPLTWNDGFMLQNGKAVAADGRSVSDFCLCPAESQIEYVSETANQYVQGIAFYDKYKTPIIGYANNGKDGEPCIVTSPKDVYYLRLSIVKSNADKAYFKSSVPTVKSFIERNSHSLITAQDTDFAEIEVTNYMLICDIIKNKVYTVHNDTYAGFLDSKNKDSSTLCILDKTKDMYAGNIYSVDVAFFDSDREFISLTNALHHGTKLAKEQYPSNAKYVAFTWSKNGVIADKMYVSTVDNSWQTGLPALKYGKTIKYKGQRPIINIYNSDTQEEIFDKLADACYTQDCDVYFEKGTYIFDTIYDKIKTYYNSVGDAFEMLLGGNCRYYMYGCTFKGDFTNSTVKSSTFGSHRHAGSYELFGGTIICIDGDYCVHDEVSGEELISVRKYHHVTFKYVKGSTYSNWICKCLGCGTGKNTITIIDGCYFESDNDLCAAEASWHGNLEDESACETFIEIKNSYFKDKGFYVDAIPSGSKQVGKIIFCNNSVKNKLPTESNGWILAGWNNEVRSAN